MADGGRKHDTSDMALGAVYYGIVTQNKDPEGLARVKIRLPWMPGGDQDQTHWARVSVPMIGGEFGAFTLPEIDDTVMVMFIAGDVRWPVVIGGMWNNTDTPPETNENGKNDFRFIKSRAGHRLLFDDSSNTKVALTDFTNEQYVGVGKTAEGGDGPNAMELALPDGGGSSGASVVSAGGDINIWCPSGTLTVKAKAVKLQSGNSTDIKSGGDMTLEGNMATAAASAMAKFEGSKVKIN